MRCCKEDPDEVEGGPTNSPPHGTNTQIHTQNSRHKYMQTIPHTNSRNPPRRWWRRGTWQLGRCQRPNGCAPRAQLPAEELLSTLQGSAHETPTRSDGARPSSSSTGAGSCVHDERVWTGVGCESRGSTGSGVLHWRRTTQHSGGQPPSLARRVRRPRQEQHSSGCERGAAVQRKLSGAGQAGTP